MKQLLKLIIILIVILTVLCLSDAKSKKRKKYSKQMILRQKETNAVNFIRLAVMRLIYGIATRIGLGEQISEALNGAFVPPGVDEYDDYGGGNGDFTIFDRDDDYDY